MELHKKKLSEEANKCQHFKFPPLPPPLCLIIIKVFDNDFHGAIKKKRPREIKSLCCQSPKWRLFVGLRETTIRPATTTPTACRTKVPEISHRRRDDEWFFFFFFWWWWWRLGPWPGVVLFYVYKTLSAGVELHKAVTCLDKSWRIRNESELRRRRHQKKKRKEKKFYG